MKEMHLCDCGIEEFIFCFINYIFLIDVSYFFPRHCSALPFQDKTDYCKQGFLMPSREYVYAKKATRSPFTNEISHKWDKSLSSLPMGVSFINEG